MRQAPPPQRPIKEQCQVFLYTLRTFKDLLQAHFNEANQQGKLYFI
jgi:hypothetical protein